MQRALPTALQEDAKPVAVLQLMPARLAELFPVRFSDLDPLAEAEPSRGALIELDEVGTLAVVVYGTITGRTTISFPASASFAAQWRALRSEVPLRDDEIVWMTDALRDDDMPPVHQLRDSYGSARSAEQGARLSRVVPKKP